MVLMCIFAIMRKNQIGRNGSLHFFENAFDLGANEGHKGIFKIFEYRTLQAIGRNEQASATPCLSFSRANRTQYNPMKLRAGIELREAQNRAATANLNIIGVASNAQHLHWPGCFFVKSDVNHSAASAPKLSVSQVTHKTPSDLFVSN